VRRKKGRHRGTASRANNDLTAHIASLDLGTVEEYRSWCHAHGLTAALNKGWQERRQERQLVERDRVKAGVEKEQMEHVEALGLETVEAYQTWCREQGLSDSVNKGAGVCRAVQNMRCRAVQHPRTECRGEQHASLRRFVRG